MCRSVLGSRFSVFVFLIFGFRSSLPFRLSFHLFGAIFLLCTFAFTLFALVISSYLSIYSSLSLLRSLSLFSHLSPLRDGDDPYLPLLLFSISSIIFEFVFSVSVFFSNDSDLSIRRRERRLNSTSSTADDLPTFVCSFLKQSISTSRSFFLGYS